MSSIGAESNAAFERVSNRIRPQHRRAPLIIDPGDRVFAQVVCNDGAAAIVTVDYDFGPAGYVIDYAARFDPATGFYNLELSKDHNGLRVESFHRLGGVDTACIGQPAPVPLHSDDSRR